MKRTSLLLILAALPAVLLPLAATGQAAPPVTVHEPKYEVYAGFAYTNLDQVNQSRHGLMGVRGAITRDWGKYFGLTASGDYFKWATGSGNPGNPVVYDFLVGPEVHFKLFSRWSGAVFGEVGGEHTGGEQMTPNISFAGGFGGSITHDLNRHWALRASGDRLAASFSLRNNTNQLSNSTHMVWNARGMFGVVYRF